MTFAFRRRSAALAALSLALALALGAAPARAQSYPHLGLYAMVYEDGTPLWNSDGTPNQTAFQDFAHFNELIIEPTMFTPYHPEAIQELRALRPGISLLAYVPGHHMWYSNSPDSLVHFPTRYWRLIRNMGGFLYNRQGSLFGSLTGQNADVNIAMVGASGRYVVAESLAVLFNNAIYSSGMWDGIFLDTFCDNMSWMESPAESVDFVRAGYPTHDAFLVGWKAGTDTLAARLRQLTGPGAVLVGNCGQGTKYAWFNGWMREDFPNQNGGTWYSNMYRDPGGYFVDDSRFRTPTHDYIFTACWDTLQPYSADNVRRMRFGLASAALGQGFATFGPPDRSTRGAPFYGWWYDEFAVDLSTGLASNDPARMGWLGQPFGPAYQMIWVGTGPDAVTNPSFETDVSTGWRFFTNSGATLDRDTTTAAVGTASAHVFVSVASPTVPWATSLTSTGTIFVLAGQNCTATFWARASVPRTLLVSAARTTSGEWAGQTISVTTEWKQYQVVLTPTGSGAAQLQFSVAGAAGDIWFDDCHLQNGVTGVYRRDFQNGIVLVNPGATTQSVVLEHPYRRILGTVDPLANDGVESNTVDVPANDARFLIGADTIPPASIQDLHVKPPAAPQARQQPRR